MMTLSGAWHKLRDRPDPQVPDRVAVVLRHGDVRRPDDVDQDRQRAVALHRLDHRPRALPARSAGSAFISIGSHLLPDPAPVRPARRCTACALIDAALLDRHPRHRALHRRDVDRRRHAGPDVARDQRRRHADLHASSRASRRPIRSTRSASSAALLYLVGMLHHGLEHVRRRCAAARPVDAPIPVPASACRVAAA